MLFFLQVFFLDFRTGVIRGYPKLFGEASEEEQEDFNEFSEEAQFSKQWGWFSSIYQLAKGDVTKIDIVTREGLFKCLNMLTFEKQKNEIEIRQIKKANDRLL